MAGPITAIVLVVVLGMVAVALAFAAEHNDREDEDRAGPIVDFDPGRPEGESEPNVAAWVDPTFDGSNELVTVGETVCSTRERVLFCLDAETGDEIFSQTLADTATSPALAGETLVVGHDSEEGGALFGYSLDGRQLWTLPVEDPLASDLSDIGLSPRAPPVAGDVVATLVTNHVSGPGSGEEELVGIDAGSGQERWRAAATFARDMTTDGQRFYATVSVSGSVTVDDLRSLDPADPVDAEIISFLDWTTTLDWSDPAELQSLIDMGILVDINAVLRSHVIVAFDSVTGAELWRSEIDPAWGEYLVLVQVVPSADGTTVALVLVGEQSRLAVVDAATGERGWDVPFDSPYVSNTPVSRMAEVTVVVDDAELRGYDESGSELWSVAVPESEFASSDVGSTGLVVDQGRLFTVGTDVFEIDPRDGSSRPVREIAFATDVAVLGDLLVIAGIGELQAVPLP